jgi:hypothetical protein
MLITTAFVAALIYKWVGLSILRRAWLNVDLLWVLALLMTGGLLLFGGIAKWGQGEGFGANGRIRRRQPDSLGVQRQLAIHHALGMEQVPLSGRNRCSPAIFSPVPTTTLASSVSRASIPSTISRKSSRQKKGEEM